MGKTEGAVRFAAVTGATAYASEVFDDFHSVRTVASEGPVVSLEKIWGEIPVGYITVICRGTDADGTPMPYWEKFTTDHKHGIFFGDEIYMNKSEPTEKEKFLLTVN